jgi:hypothetical protein
MKISTFVPPGSIRGLRFPPHWPKALPQHDMSPTGLETMQDYVARSLGERRELLYVFGSFAALALILPGRLLIRPVLARKGLTENRTRWGRPEQLQGVSEFPIQLACQGCVGVSPLRAFLP